MNNWNPQKVYAPHERCLHAGREWQGRFLDTKELNEGEEPGKSNFWVAPQTLQHKSNKVGLRLSRAKPASHPDREV